MIQSILALILIYVGQFAIAQDYGRIQITVVKPNLSHHFRVKFKLNNKQVGEFSHAMSVALDIPISKSMLSSGKATLMSADYSNFKEGCEFLYNVTYVDKYNQKIPLGQYNAPTQTAIKDLPIGFCGDNLCSNDINVQSNIDRAIENARIQEAKENERRKQELLRAKRQKIQDIRAARNKRRNEIMEQLLERSNEARKAYLDKSLTQTVVEKIRYETPLSGFAERMIAEREENRRFVEMRKAEMDYQKAEAMRMADYVNSISPNVKCYDGISCTSVLFGMAIMKSINQNLGTNDYQANETSYDRYLARKEAGLKAAIANQNYISQQMIAKNHSSAVEAARLGVAFSPMNDYFDLCEAITGKEMCLTNGGTLSSNQRIMAVLGIMVGNRMVWETLTDAARLSIFKNMTTGLSKAESKILANDLKQATIRKAEDVNRELAAGGVYTDPPYRPGTDVIEFTPSVDISNTYVRVSKENNIARRWIVDKAMIEGKSAEDINKALQLGYVPTHISDVKLPANEVTLRMGQPNRIFDTKGDLVPVQVEIVQRYQQDIEPFFVNTRILK